MRAHPCHALFIALASLLVAALPAGAAPQPSPVPGAPPVLRRVAVASFLEGRRQPEMDESMDRTLSCPIGEICREDPSILPNAGITLTRLVQQALKVRFGDQVVPRRRVRDAEMQIALDQAKDTPRSLAMRLGRLLDVDVVVIGTVWRYRNRGAIEGVPDTPASVAFALYFIDAKDGRRLWRGLFDASQHTVLENVLKAGEQLKLGLKWLSADELAARGVKEVLGRFPPTILGGADQGAQRNP